MWTYGIYARVVDVSKIEHVRFLIQKQRVCKYHTKHFPCGIVFIIYILRFKFLLIVFNDRPRQNSVTRIQVKNSCKYYNITGLNFWQKFNTTASKNVKIIFLNFYPSQTPQFGFSSSWMKITLLRFKREKTWYAAPDWTCSFPHTWKKRYAPFGWLSGS